MLASYVIDRITKPVEGYEAFERPESCDRCDLCKTSEGTNGKRYVCLHGDGPGLPTMTLNNVDTVVLGDFPSVEDIQSRLPLHGETGRLFNKLLEFAGIDRRTLYIDNVVKCHPPKNKVPTEYQIIRCRKYLEEAMQRIKPKVIVTMGVTATHAVLGWGKSRLLNSPNTLFAYDAVLDGTYTDKDIKLLSKYSRGAGSRIAFPKLEHLRGNVFWHEEFNCYVVPTYHPNACAPSKGKDEENSFVGKALTVIRDLKLSQDFEALERRLRPLPIVIKIAQTAEQVEQAVDFLLKKDLLSFDIETSGLSHSVDEILCVQIAWSGTHALVVPLKGQIKPTDENYEDAKKGRHVKCPDIWNPIEYKRIKTALHKLLSSNIAKIAHNGSFDINFLRYNGIEVNNVIFDTIVAHHLLEENLSHKLEFLAVWYTDMGRYDAELDNFKPNTKCSYAIVPPSILYPYGAKDVMATFRIYQCLKEELKADRDLYRLMFQQQMPANEALMDIKYRGLLVDKDLTESLNKDLTTKIQQLYEELQTEYTKYIPDFNPNSNTHVEKILFDHLKFSVSKLTKGGGRCVDKNVLKALAQKHDFPKKVLALRALEKFKGTYVVGMDKHGNLTGMVSYMDAEGLIHPDLILFLTKTGRTCSKRPNAQNLPKDSIIRNLIIPRPGYKFCEADYKAAEIRALADISRDDKLRERCMPGIDIHAETASEIYNIPMEEILRQKKENGFCPQRDYAKTILFGIIYGESARSLAGRLGIEIDEAQKIIKGIFKMYPKVEELMRKYHSLASKGLPIVTPFGRKRRLHADIYTEEIYPNTYYALLRQAMNAPIQATASDITIRSLTALHNAFKQEKLDIYIVLTVHDSILFEFRDNEATKKRMYELLEKHMVYRFPGSKVRYYIDTHESDKWEKS